MDDPKSVGKADAKADRQNAYGTSKEQILRVAEDLFAQQGFISTTLKDVARESGANTALVGYHFGSKEGLRQAVIEKQLSSIQQSLDEVVSVDIEMTVDVFKDVLKKYLYLAKTDPHYYRTLLWSILDGGELTAQVTDGFVQPLLQQMKGAIGKINPKLTPQDAEVRGIFILGLFLNYAQMHWHYFELIKTEACVEFVKDEYTNILVTTALRVALQ